MSDLTSKEHVDRLPILVSGGKQEKLLSIKKLSSTGKVQAQAVFQRLSNQEWNLAKILLPCVLIRRLRTPGKTNVLVYYWHVNLEKLILASMQISNI